jgi:hypothetical protein
LDSLWWRAQDFRCHARLNILNPTGTARNEDFLKCMYKIPKSSKSFDHDLVLKPPH